MDGVAQLQALEPRGVERLVPRSAHGPRGNSLPARLRKGPVTDLPTTLEKVNWGDPDTAHDRPIRIADRPGSPGFLLPLPVPLLSQGPGIIEAVHVPPVPA